MFTFYDILYNFWENEFLGDQENNLWQWILKNFMKEYFLKFIVTCSVNYYAVMASSRSSESVYFH